MWFIGLAVSKEVVYYGTTQLASGLSQLIYTWIFSESTWLIFGWVSIGFGLFIMILGLLWTWKPFERPLGITLLGLGYGFVGSVALFAGGWLFSPLLLLAIICYAAAWGLFKGKSWAWIATLLMSGLGLLISLIIGAIGTSIPMVESYPLVPSVLSSAYLLWYLNRPHVANFFGESPIISGVEMQENIKALIAVVMLLLLLILPLSNFYINPPTTMVISETKNLWGDLGGAAGTFFSANKDDLLNYHFLNTEGSEVRFWIATDEIPEVTIAEETGVEGSGSVRVPLTTRYIMRVSNIVSDHISVECKIQATLFSMRRPIMQWLLLDLYTVSVVILLILTRLRK